MDDSTEAVAALQPLFLAIVRKLVDHPETVALKPATAGADITFNLYIEKADVGNLIGKQGSHARALRHLLTAFGSKYAQRFKLKVHTTVSEE